MRAEYLTKDLISLSPDTLVVVDSVDPRIMHILDSNSGKETNKITHTVEVTWYVRSSVIYMDLLRQLLLHPQYPSIFFLLLPPLPPLSLISSPPPFLLLHPFLQLTTSVPFLLLLSVCLNQHTLGPQDRLLAFCDKNKDLYLGYLAGTTGSTGYAGSNVLHFTSFSINNRNFYFYSILFSPSSLQFMSYVSCSIH